MPQKIKQSEKQTQSAICDYLRYKGWTVYDLRRPKFSKGKGLPDLLAWKDELMIFIEVKSPTTYYTTTYEQRAFFRSLKKVRKVQGCVARGIEDLPV
jgi:Holliday junction resolvase